MNTTKWNLSPLEQVLQSSLCNATSANLEDLFDTESKMDGGAERKSRIMTEAAKEALTNLHKKGLIVIGDSFFVNGIFADGTKVTPFSVTADGLETAKEL